MGPRTRAVAWALGIGMLFSQAGWRWLRRDADCDRALACHRLADAAFTALGAPDFAQQTLADRALAHDAGGDWEAALVASDRRAARDAGGPGAAPGVGGGAGARARAIWRTSPARSRTARRTRRCSSDSAPRSSASTRARRRGARRGLDGLQADMRDALMREAAAMARNGDRPRLGRAFAPLSARSPCAE